MEARVELATARDNLVLYQLSYSVVDEPYVHSVHTVRWLALVRQAGLETRYR